MQIVGRIKYQGTSLNIYQVLLLAQLLLRLVIDRSVLRRAAPLLKAYSTIVTGNFRLIILLKICY